MAACPGCSSAGQDKKKKVIIINNIKGIASLSYGPFF